MKSVYMIVLALAVCAALLCVRPAAAHHSGAGFDPTKVVEIKGTIKEFQFKNPHTWIQVLVEEGGKTTEWSLEWGSPNQLGRMGYRPSSFPAGAPPAMAPPPVRAMTSTDSPPPADAARRIASR